MTIDPRERLDTTPERRSKLTNGTVDVIENEGGGKGIATGRRIVSPLDNLLAREQIEPCEFDAAVHFYRDWYYAERPSAHMMRWTEFVDTGSAPGDLDAAERAAFHSRRFQAALRLLGPYQGAVARLLIIDELDCTNIGRRLNGYTSDNSAAAAGFAQAAIVLDTLARYYGLKR
jgi:hypothetical protein